jgi:RimJ/RimL family protein N-acetyltransferase
MIRTERLAIRRFELDDWKALREMILQYQASPYAIYDHPWPTSANEIKGVTEWFASGDRFHAVCLKETGRLIGFVSLNTKEDIDNRVFGLGYCFNFDYHRQGYATEACRAAIDHAFDQLDAQSFVTGTGAENIPSCRLLERLGFRRTAQGTGAFWETEDGEPIEFLGYTYTLTKDEWASAQP